MKTEISVLVLEEALDCVRMRVGWYEKRGYDVPEATRLAFNMLCSVLGKPDEKPWIRIR
jgi:hypothetical protein